MILQPQPVLDIPLQNLNFKLGLEERNTFNASIFPPIALTPPFGNSIHLVVSLAIYLNLRLLIAFREAAVIE